MLRATKKNLKVGMVLQYKDWWTGEIAYMMILCIEKFTRGDYITAITSPYPNRFWLPHFDITRERAEFRSEGYRFLRRRCMIVSEEDLKRKWDISQRRKGNP